VLKSRRTATAKEEKSVSPGFVHALRCKKTSAFLCFLNYACLPYQSGRHWYYFCLSRIADGFQGSDGSKVAAALNKRLDAIFKAPLAGRAAASPLSKLLYGKILGRASKLPVFCFLKYCPRCNDFCYYYMIDYSSISSLLLLLLLLLLIFRLLLLLFGMIILVIKLL
jgi:hypothetical protein